MNVFIGLLALVAVASAGILHGHSSKLHGLSGIGYAGGIGLKTTGLGYGGLKSFSTGYVGDLGLKSHSLKYTGIAGLKSHDIGYAGGLAYGDGLGLNSHAVAYSGDIGLGGHDIAYSSGIGLSSHDIGYAGGLASYGTGYGYGAGAAYGYGLDTVGAIGAHDGFLAGGVADHSLHGATLDAGHGIGNLALTGSAGLGYAGGYASGYEDWC